MFAGGCVLIAGLLGSAAASLFPVILYSTVSPEYSITAYNVTWVYFWFVGKHYRGRVRMPQDSHEPY